MNQHQIVVTRGDSRTLDFSDLTDGEGAAYDLNNVDAIAFRVDGLFAKTLDDFTLDASSGDIQVDIGPADTEDCGDYRHPHRYDLAFTFSDGSVRTVRRGLFIVVPDVPEL